MNIELKNIKIQNFKGVSSLEIEFDDHTKIYGDNATGKTSVFDAFWWLLFGKDSEGKAQFNVKPLDANNNPIHHKEVEVEALLDVDGTEYNFKRVLKENWVNRRGSTDKVLDGHKTKYFWDDVPLKQKEFEQKVASIINEETFKLLTNARYFNSLHWEQRREIMFDMAGDVNYQDVADQQEGFQALLDRISGKSVDDYRKEVSSKKRKIKEELDEVPTRIDEVNKSMPEPVDEKAISTEIAALDKQIAEVDDQISDVVKANEQVNKAIIEKQNRARDLQSQLDQVKADAEQKVMSGIREYESQKSQLESKLQQLQDQRALLIKRGKDLESQISATDAEMSELRDEWNKINAETFQADEDALKCSACGQELPKKQQEKSQQEQQANFHFRRTRRLTEISDRGTRSKEYKDQLRDLWDQAGQQLTETDTATISIQAELKALKKPEEAVISADDQKRMDDLSSQIEAIEKELQEPRGTTSTEGLKQQRAELERQRDQKRQELSVADQIARSKKRVAELEAQQRDLSQQLANLEADEQVINDLIKARIEAIEERVNALFERVRFKMYEQQLNEGERPTCVTLINGVPYSDANNAGRINAGIDIINALSRHYDVTAPVWVDNAEAVVNVTESNGQTIALYVSEAHPSLHIETAKREELAEAV